MDLTFDREGNLWGVTTTLQPTLVPAILYRIDLQTGAAKKVVDLVGSGADTGTRRIVAEAGEAAGIGHLTTHAFRHYAECGITDIRTARG